jgi:hypothetical protein
VWTIAPAATSARTHAARVSPLASGEHLKAKPSRTGTAHLDHDPDQGLLAVPASDISSLAASSDQGLIDLDLAAERLALGGDHRSAQLLQDQPASLVARDPELALELHGGDPRCLGADQVGRPEPQRERGREMVGVRCRSACDALPGPERGALGFGEPDAAKPPTANGVWQRRAEP